MPSELLGSIISSIFSATFFGAILRGVTPILLPSIGALISDRAGVINIGLEGIMLLAAFTGATLGALTGSALVGLGLGLVVAVLAALLLAFFHLQLKGDLILGGIALNILGSAGTVAIGYAISGDRAGGVNLRAVELPIVELDFLKSIPGVGGALYTIIGAQNVMTWIAFISVVVVGFIMFRTPFGKHLRATGENPEAAASVGINVARTRYLALALSGLLAGLGGIFMSMGYVEGFSRDMTAGRGYIALVAPALGGGTPVGTMLASLLFGAFDALSFRLGNLDLPSQFPRMIPYAATIIALVIYSIRQRQSAIAKMRRVEQTSAGS